MTPAFFRSSCLVIALLILFPFNTNAVDPSEILGNATLEKRARHISKDLRCLVCQNQSIDDSDAPLARDLRLLVRERLIQGDTDNEVFDYVVSRYGDFVLLRPPVKAVTAILWLGPAIFVLIGFIGLLRYFRRQSKDENAEDQNT
ncbi:cytochrome c-type biogenesis protein CcmH [Rhodospirillales bacterium]|nr:cytochrome c-type biogenesis protein CcmH [Rhodospirillales bacterium]